MMRIHQYCWLSLNCLAILVVLILLVADHVEIVDDDGSMARGNRLHEIAEKFNFPIITIAELINYRTHHEKLIEELSSIPFPTEYGKFVLKFHKFFIFQQYRVPKLIYLNHKNKKFL